MRPPAQAGCGEARKANGISSSLENRHLPPGTSGATLEAVTAGRLPSGEAFPRPAVHVAHHTAAASVLP